MHKSHNDIGSRRIVADIHSKKSSFWMRKREENALDLFHRAAHGVPAYRDFLKKNKVSPDKIRTFQDFANVPPVSKKDYLRAYPMSSLMWNGVAKKPYVFVSTSGSTGEPFYFPRSEALEWEYSVMIDMFLEQSTRKGPVLVVICFGMGVWIGGLITYKAFEISSRRSGAPISIITPGLGKAEIFNALKKLSPMFTQTIIVGYPPFVKDIIDEAPLQGIDPKKLNLRLLFAAEAFTEQFRDYLSNKAGVSNPYRDTLNIYGTADIGAMAWETPAAIILRRLAVQKKMLFQSLFGAATKTPTLAQYNPIFMTFEAPDGEILLSGDSAIPLVRYAVGDRGGVFSFKEAIEKANMMGINVEKEAVRQKISFLAELPFVYVYERSDFSIVHAGANIYPAEVREVLEKNPFTESFTSKFTMGVRNDKKYNEIIEIHIELKPNIKGSLPLKKMAQDAIVKNLLKRNSEYESNHKAGIPGVVPEIIFHPYEDPNYFKPGIKQKWVIKDKIKS